MMQLVEHPDEIGSVGGSIPLITTTIIMFFWQSYGEHNRDHHTN